MIATLSQDKKFLSLTFASENEMMQTQVYFRRKVKNYIFLKKKYKNWSGEVNYLINNSTIKATMWNRLIDMCEQYGFDLEFVNWEGYIREMITYEFVEKFCQTLLSIHEKIIPRDYQIDAVYKAIKYRTSCLDVATSGGKTLIMYMYMMTMRYLRLSQHILIITPIPDLTIQSYDEFCDYACGKYDLKMALIHGNSKDKKKLDRYNHAIGNFQSLVNLPKEYFEKFDTIICDEAHRSTAKSIQDIINSCCNYNNLVGLSGSFPQGKKDADEFTIENNFGPIVKHIRKKDLIDKGAATNIIIKMIDIKFCNQQELAALTAEKDFMEDKEKALRYEQQFIRNSKVLLEWKCQFISRLKGNTLVYFLDKKGGYGKKIFDRLNDISYNKGLGKKIFYIDGDTPVSDRETYKEIIRNNTDGNCILVANYGTFSTGQSIKNLINVVAAESVKSDILVNQSSGRLLRLAEGKTKSFFYDLVENTNCSYYNKATETNENRKCYMYNWSRDRMKYYRSENLQVENFSIDISTAKVGNYLLSSEQTLF